VNSSRQLSTPGVARALGAAADAASVISTAACVATPFTAAVSAGIVAAAGVTPTATHSAPAVAMPAR
jgi:hypothetical protein